MQVFGSLAGVECVQDAPSAPIDAHIVSSLRPVPLVGIAPQWPQRSDGRHRLYSAHGCALESNGRERVIAIMGQPFLLKEMRRIASPLSPLYLPSEERGKGKMMHQNPIAPPFQQAETEPDIEARLEAEMDGVVAKSSLAKIICWAK